VRIRLCMLAVLAGSACVAACAEKPSATPAEIEERGELVVGTEAEFHPFEYRTEDGAYAGFDMDLARLIAEELGVELRIENMKFAGLIPSLDTGRIDVIMSGMTATDERRKTISFTDPYFLTGLCLLVNVESAGGVTDWRTLNDPKWTVVVKTATTSDTFVRENLPKAKGVTLETENDCALEVATGRADAFIYDQLSIQRHHEEHPETTKAYLEPLTREPYSIGVRHDDDELREFLNGFLATLREDGRFAELVEKHGLPASPSPSSSPGPDGE